MNMYYLSDILLLLGFILLIIEAISIIVKYLKYKNKLITNINGYDIAKLLIDKNKILGINIIETTSKDKNTYNIGRNTIKLSNNTYNSYNIFNLSLSVYLAGYTILKDSNNNYLSTYNKIFKNISYISISSIPILITSILFKGYYSILGLLILSLLFIYSYIRKAISNENIEIIEKNLNKLKMECNSYMIDIIKTIDNAYNITMIIATLQISRLIIYLIN